MAQVTTGANRLFGGTTMARMSELRRQTVVAASEIKGLIPLDSDFPTRISVKRVEKTADGRPSVGVMPTYSVIAGLGDLVGHIRTDGSWVDERTNLRVALGDADRIVLLVDVPAGGHGLADEILLTDRLVFDDPIKGASTVWDVRSVDADKRDGIVAVLVKYARED